ncbi:MAG: hypothetical protein DI551_10800, partial [Micavibrio aeruginosavorus]
MTNRVKKSRSIRFQRVFTYGALTLAASALPYAHAFALDDNALPTGGNVVGGSATIGQSGNNLNI